MKEKLLVLVLTLCWNYHAAGQPDGGRIRISVISGGSVPFVFNSINDYQNGKTLSFWTVFGITLQDTGNSDFTYDWRLMFKAIPLGTTIISDGPAPNLPLNTIRLTASAFAGMGFPGVTFLGPLDLTDVDQDIARDVAPSGVPGVAEEPVSPTDQIAITYNCGTVTPLLGTPADYYTVDIDFTLEGFIP